MSAFNLFTGEELKALFVPAVATIRGGGWSKTLSNRSSKSFSVNYSFYLPLTPMLEWEGVFVLSFLPVAFHVMYLNPSAVVLLTLV